MLEKLRDDPEVVERVIKQLRKLPWQVHEYPDVSSIDYLGSMSQCNDRS